MDRRIQKTKAAVFAAFEELLSAKKYENITVQDIIDRANIGRSTFYAHFETRDDLLKAVCAELFSHVFNEHSHAETSHDFSAGNNTLTSVLTHILYHLKDDSKRYSRIFRCESSGIFWSYFRDQLSVLMSEYSHRQTSDDSEIPEDFRLDFYSGAFIEAVKWWFRNGLEVSPEKLVTYYVTLTNQASAFC